MKDYLVDYETLAKTIDALIAQKYPHESAKQHGALREKSIDELDEAIGTAIFGNLTGPELDKFNKMLDQESTTTEEFQNFFKNTDLNLTDIIEKSTREYSAKFLEGDENA